MLVGSFGGELALMVAGTYPDEVSGTVLARSTLTLEVKLDPPKLRKQIEEEVDDNPEHVDLYDAFKETEASLDDVTEDPIPTCFASRYELPAEWPEGADGWALHEFVDGLPHGRLVKSKQATT